MGREYLKDVKFLKALEDLRIREHYVRLIVLNFKEEPLREIQGIATAGNITVNGSSAVRRTINLTLVAPNDENDLSNIDNIISSNKKIKVEAGIKNPFQEYAHYGEIVWFSLGVFLITEATSSTTALSATITIKGKDKMCMLDGTCGGILPATVSFHEAQEIGEDGKVYVTKVPIFTIIKECVRHYGQEIEQNIVINDVDLIARQSVQYIGSEPIWFDENFQLSPAFGSNIEDRAQYTKKFIYGQDIGYIETDFTYPGELVFSAGEPVTAVLDKIIQTIGNYEYFYDLEGKFVFQQKKNYLNNYYTPITEINDYYYVRAFSDSKYYKVIENAKDSISYFNSPKYDNLKNDFVVWGTRTDKDGVTNSIKYHLAIDEKPVIDLAGQYMWDVVDGNDQHLFYIFDYENREYAAAPEKKPIVLDLANTVLEENIISIIEDYLKITYLEQITADINLTLWFKIIWRAQVRYYCAHISQKEITYIIYYEEYTDIIGQENLVIAIQMPEEKEEDKDDGESYLPGMNPDMDTENKFQKFKSKAVETKKPFVALEIRQIENLYSLGYYNEKQEWQNIYQLSQKPTIALSDIDSMLSAIAKKYLTRIFTFEDFNEEKNYNFNIIETINNISLWAKDSYPNYLIIDNKEIPLFYEFKDITKNDGFIIFSKEERKTLITNLTEFYPTDATNLRFDLEAIFNEGKGKNLLPTYNPDMNTENEWNQGQFLKDYAEWQEIVGKPFNDEGLKVISDKNIINLIYKYMYAGNTVDDLIKEIVSYWGNYCLEKNEDINSNFILTVITREPDERPLSWGENLSFNLIGCPCNEWREELYRQALLNQESAGESGFYDEELLAFWRTNFDTMNLEWEAEWRDFIDLNKDNPWEGWNPNIYRDPGLLVFWLDFLDNEQLIAKYSVNQIGRRTKALAKENIQMLYRLEVPDVLFIPNSEKDLNEKIAQYQNDGQKYFVIKDNWVKYFSSSSIGSTAFDLIREMLYSYLTYNTNITITCIPKYYLEPNNLIYVSDEASNIQGDFIITQYTVPLTYNGTMSINATQALTRV